MKISARAHANIALVKYWGKRDAALNLPAASSLSLTLDALTTTTTVEPAERDALTLDGKPVTGRVLARLSDWLDVLRAEAGRDQHLQVTSTNDFPTAAGLASSASGYAALAVAVSKAFGLGLDPRALSIRARRGSGSAARSIFGGFVLLRAGAAADGSDAFAEPIAGAEGWPIAMVVAVVGAGKAKKVSSREGMTRSAVTSPLYPGFLAQVPVDLAAARAAIARRDLDALGEVAEGSALTMHGAAMAARPAIVYFVPTTLAVMAEVRALRAAGVAAYYTMDAGPHVKVLTELASAGRVAETLAAVPGVSRAFVARPGQSARLLASEP